MLTASGWVLVTGGNRGLGLVVCSKLLASGRKFILCSRDGAAGRRAAAELAERAGRPGDCVSLQLDTSSKESIITAVKTILKEYQQNLQAVINNAALYNGKWEKATWQQFYATNYAGPVMLAQLLAPSMLAGGHIIMVSSGLGQQRNISQAYSAEVAQADSLDTLGRISYRPDSDMARSYNACYCLSKAMIIRAAQLLATHPKIGGLDICVNAVDPGWCRTRMGGMSAPRSDQEGAASILAPLFFDKPATGGFFFDGRPKSL